MSEPRPEFVKVDPIAKYEAAKAKYEETVRSLTGNSDFVLEPSIPEWLQLCNAAYIGVVNDAQMQHVAEQNYVLFATYPALDHWGEQLVGKARLAARRSKVSLRFEMDQLYPEIKSIPEGTQVQSDDGKYVFEVLENTFSQIGDLTIDADAYATMTGPEADNYQPGTVTKLLSFISYISSVSNNSVSAGGADIETDTRYRERIFEAFEENGAGSTLWYHSQAMGTNQNILDTYVTSPEPGSVDVHLLMNRAGGEPTPEEISEVQEFLDQEDVRPHNDIVIVKSGESIHYNIITEVKIREKNPDGTKNDVNTAKNAMEDELTAFVEKLGSGFGYDVILDQIMGVLARYQGFYSAEILEPQADIVLEGAQWASNGLISVRIVEIMKNV